MTTPKHTPGPWEISGISMNDGSVSIRHAEHRIVISYVTNAASLGDFVAAAMRGRRDFGAPDTAHTQWANARLISAAPDMLAALKTAHTHLEHMAKFIGERKLGYSFEALGEDIGNIRDAIVKAEGR